MPVAAAFAEDEADDAMRALRAVPKPKEFVVPKFMHGFAEKEAAKWKDEVRG